MARRNPKNRAPGDTHIIANIKYVKRSDELLGKLKYAQYRDDKHDHIPHRRGQPRPKRWIDRGLGSNYREIFKHCQARQSQHVLAWTWVISPDPKLMALVPERERRRLLERVTEDVVEGYYQERREPLPLFSYVLHDRDASTGLKQLHTHVYLPGTVETPSGNKAFYNQTEKGHIGLFNQVAETEFLGALDDLEIPWRSLSPTEPTPSVTLADVLSAVERLGNSPPLLTASTPAKPPSELDLWFGTPEL